MVLSFIWIVDLILIGICLLLLLTSLAGKLSPKSVLFLILLFIVGYFGMLRKWITEKEFNAIDTPISLVDPIISEDTLAKEKKDLDKPSEENREEIPLNNRNKNEETIPKEYEVEEGLRTYRTEGKWEWDDKFKQALKNKTGWKKQKKGNYIISVDYQEFFKPIEENKQQRFVYLGGEIEMTVNSKNCCCTGIVSIPSGISGKNVAELKNIIQDTITSLLLKNEELVIDKINACL